MLYGITHTQTGEPVMRLAKTLKVGIGYPKGPAVHVYISKSGEWVVEIGTGKNLHRQRSLRREEAFRIYQDAKKTAETRKYPGKFGYFTFQRVGIDGSFSPDWDAIEAHGAMPTEIPIVFLDNSPLRQQFEWWTAAELKCHGDGKSALRRNSEAKTDAEKKAAQQAADRGEQFFPVAQCFTGGCPYAKGDRPLCKPHSRLSFQLANAPALGSSVTFDSTGFRSASQLFSSLEQIRTITGRGNPEDGVVAGIRLMLKLLPYKTSHNGQPATQFGVTLYLKASDAIELIQKAIAQGDQFRAVASAPLQIEGAVDVSGLTEEVETPSAETAERLPESAEAATMEAEFYPSEESEGEWIDEAEPEPIQTPVKALAIEETITREQAERLEAIARQAGIKAKAFSAFLLQFGYSNSEKIRKEDFDRMVSELQKGDAQ